MALEPGPSATSIGIGHPTKSVCSLSFTGALDWPESPAAESAALVAQTSSSSAAGRASCLVTLMLTLAAAAVSAFLVTGGTLVDKEAPRTHASAHTQTHRLAATTDYSHLPNVMVVGAPKAGTTALFDWMHRQPMVCDPIVLHGEAKVYQKEVHFFNKEDRRKRGTAFYARRWAHCTDPNSIRIDATPNYMPFARFARATYDDAGGGQAAKLKLIMILRDPVARDFSWYQMLKRKARTRNPPPWVARGLNGAQSFEEFASNIVLNTRTCLSDEALCKRDLSTLGMYQKWLSEWAEHFGRDHLLVLSQAELLADPATALSRVSAFLGTSGAWDAGGMKKTNASCKKLPCVSVPPCAGGAELAELYAALNEELYSWLEMGTGPSMEQRPFPRFSEYDSCGDEV